MSEISQWRHTSSDV